MNSNFAKILPFSVLLMATRAGAQPASAPLPDCVDLDGKAAVSNPVDKDGRITMFNAPAVRLMRTTADKSKGTALIFPSGGYRVLSVTQDGTTKAKYWNDLGYDTAVIEYTISGDHRNPSQATRDQAFKDALACVRLVRGKAKELGLRGNGFVMMGGSAGGHLAARTVAALPEQERPGALVLFYPAYLEEVPPGGKQQGLPLPVGKLPRLFVAIATNDEPKWVAGARDYADAWNKAPGGMRRATFKLFDDGFHGFRPGTRAAAQWPDLLKAFDAGK